MTAQSSSSRKTIALEEHAAFPSLGAGESIPFYAHALSALSTSASKLFDVGSGRIKDMNADGINLQVLSCTAGVGVDNPSGCRMANNAMAAATQAHPTRFAAFAVLPMAFPTEAAIELERAVNKLGMVGALVDARLPDGTHYDDSKFWPVFSSAERLGVPVYLHPAPPSAEEVALRYAGNYSARMAAGFASGGWAWHADAGLGFLKLYAAGVFDAHPQLKIILGHNGEMVPAMIDRTWATMQKFGNGTPARSLGDVWNHNVWVTTSGMYTLQSFLVLMHTTKLERIMFGTDYPYDDMRHGRELIQLLEESGTLNEKELDDFTHRNAQRLLGIRV